MDNKIQYEHLSVVEKFNVMADSLAKQANQSQVDQSLVANLPLYKELGPVYITTSQYSKKITSSFRASLYNELTNPQTKTYWLHKLHIPEAFSSTISWDAISSAFGTLPTTKQIETVKWTSDFCGTGKNLQRWKEQSHSSCPICGSPGEDTHHIITCPHPTATKQWESNMQHLSTWLTHQNTAPDVTNIIVENLKSWRQNRPPVYYEGSHPFLEQAQLQQTQIGWNAFFRGFISVHWIKAQHCHLQHIGSRKNGKRWLAALIKKLWAVSWDMWRFRNGVTHSQSPTIPTNFTFLLSSTIITELNHGHRLLPPACKYLFDNNPSDILRGTINSKRLWIASVWAARDLYSPADTICQTRNIIVSSFVEAWRKRLQAHQAPARRR